MNLFPIFGSGGRSSDICRSIGGRLPTWVGETETRHNIYIFIIYLPMKIPKPVAILAQVGRFVRLGHCLRGLLAQTIFVCAHRRTCFSSSFCFCCVATAVQWSDPGTHYLPLSGLSLILAQRPSCRQTFGLGRLIRRGFIASLRLAILLDSLWSSELIQPEDFSSAHIYGSTPSQASASILYGRITPFTSVFPSFRWLMAPFRGRLPARRLQSSASPSLSPSPASAKVSCQGANKL